MAISTLLRYDLETVSYISVAGAGQAGEHYGQDHRH